MLDRFLTLALGEVSKSALQTLARMMFWLDMVAREKSFVTEVFVLPLLYESYSEINLQWAVKKNKKEGKIFYYIQKLATYVGYFST
jgi:hypothetical protein